MNRNKKFINKDKILFRMIFVVFLIFLLSCESGEKKLAEQSHNPKQIVSTDLPQIIESGVLKVITSYSPTGYFLYKGKTMGFEYEIFKRLADHLGVRLEMVIAKNVERKREKNGCVRAVTPARVPAAAPRATCFWLHMARLGR